jgi:phospholipid/cholesterol/gamma-HCH transport system substrate-binding protein
LITAIRKNLVNFAAIIGLFAIGIAVSVYILDEQRMRFPLIEEKPFEVNAEFSTAQAVIAGQGQTIRVSGVRIGDIGDVELKDGRAVVRMDIDREYASMIRTNASALLRPKTGLKDMFVELDPGTEEAPAAKQGFTIPIAATTPDVNPDEVFQALDEDTRDYLKLLVNGAGKGLEGRGEDLRDVFKRFEPIHRDLARVNSAVAERRKNLRRLINRLAVLNQALADDDDELARLVESSAAVMGAFAAEESNISDAVRELPTALAQTTETLNKVQGFAEILGPTAQKLRPAARALDEANKSVIPFAREAAPQIQEDIRPFVRDLRPLARDLKPAAVDLAAATPDLVRTFAVLNDFMNMVTYNPEGREPPEKHSRQEGFLFWLAWLNHDALNLFSSSDAHGTLRPVTLAAPCNTLREITDERPELEFLAGLSAALADSEACATG